MLSNVMMNEVMAGNLHARAKNEFSAGKVLHGDLTTVDKPLRPPREFCSQTFLRGAVDVLLEPIAHSFFIAT